MIILIDTREQKELKFPKTNCRWLKLNEGDYSTNLLINKFHIERKSPQDLYGSIIQNHMRFRREILRSINKKIKLVVYVEITRKKFIEKKWPQGDKRKVLSATLDKIINTLIRHYDLEFVWCRSRRDMVEKVLKRFRLEEKNLNTHKYGTLYD